MYIMCSITSYMFTLYSLFIQDYEQIGRAFCETLLDFSDENPNKVMKRMKLKKKIKKLRKHERLLHRAAKAAKVAMATDENN